MKRWKKNSLLTAVILIALAIGAGYFFNITLSIPSSDIEFAPGEPISKVKTEYPVDKPKNIILFMVDGMGFSHLSLALQTQQSENKSSVWQEFDVKGWHDARSANGPLTDSEASATAMATGTSTQFGHIGMDMDQNNLENIFEVASALNYNTGIVTDSYVWDGTPAAFGAHIRNEDDARSIMTQYASSELDLLFGELEDLGEDGVPEKEETLEILSQRFQLLDSTFNLPPNHTSLTPIAAVFDEDQVQDMSSSPNLLKLTKAALTYMSSPEEPFIMLIECEELDSASHENDNKRVLNGLESIQETLSFVLNFSKNNGETLVVFTADHETGGLAAVSDFNKYPNLQIRWATKNHTAAVVPLFADGPGAQNFANVHRNWEIGYVLKKLITMEQTADSTDEEIGLNPILED